MKCKYHNCHNEVNQLNTNRERQFCNKKCRNKYAVDKRRTELKFKAFQYKGAVCEMCGFKGLPACFDFHHLDPTTKTFAISNDPHTRSWDRVREEIDKCQLLCANCHRKVEFEKTMFAKTFIAELMKEMGLEGNAPSSID